MYRCQCNQLSKKYCVTSTECTEMIILVGGCVFFNYQFKERLSVRDVYSCGIGDLVSINDTRSCQLLRTEKLLCCSSRQLDCWWWLTQRCVKGSLFVPHLPVFQENIQLDVYQCIFQTQNSEVRK